MTTAFDQMLKDLQCEHNRQLAELNAQIASLREEIAQGKGSPVRVPSNPSSEDKPTNLPTFSSIPLPSHVSALKFDVGNSSGSKNTSGDPATLRSAREILQKEHGMSLSVSPISEVSKSSKRDCLPKSRYSTLKDIIESPAVDIFIAILIAMSALITALEVQFVGMKRGYSLRVAGYGNTDYLWGTGVDVLNAIDGVFSAVFIVELLLRVIALRCDIFCSAWNWLDFIVVTSSVLDWTLGGKYNNTGSKAVRMFRIVKVARILKALRVYSSFLNTLRVMLASMYASLCILCWTMVVIIGVQVICALVMTQVLESFFNEDDGNTSKMQAVFVYFGTFSRSFITFFEILLANYAVPCRVLINNVGEEYAFIIIGYRCICGFSVLAVVQAVFLQQTMKILSEDSEVMLREKAHSEHNYRKNIEDLFKSLDLGGDGHITWSELSQTFLDKQVRIYCHTLGLDPHDLEDIYHLVDDGNGVAINDFVEAAQQVRRQARTIDMARVLANERKIRLDLKRLSEKVVQCLNFQRISTTSERVRPAVDASSMTEAFQAADDDGSIPSQLAKITL